MTRNQTDSLSIADRIRAGLQRRFLDRLIANPGGRGHILNQAAAAEDSDEGQVFDVLLERVDDAKLHKMIRIHKADETRHAQMFRDVLTRNGFEPWPVPPELSLIDRLDVALGGFFDRLDDHEHPVMEAYLLLQVIEERAVTQFGEMGPVFANYDPETAATIESIARDEDRHLKYCRAIARRYAPDPETAAVSLRRYRNIEATVYAGLAAANMRHAIENDLLSVGPLERRVWRRIAGRVSRDDRPMVTPFAEAQPAAA